MVKTALKWIFFLWLLSLGAGYVEELVATWSAGRPTLAEARISELAEEIGAGELTADDLEAALAEIAELQDAEEALPAPPAPEAPPPTPTRPPSTSFEDMLERVTEAVGAANANAYEPPSANATDVATAEAKAEVAIAELDVLFGEWIAALEAVQEAHTDVWERRWAGDRVTIARSDRRRWIRDLRLRVTSSLTSDGTPYAELRKFESTTRSAIFNQGLVRDGIALAERTLTAMLATAPDAGSQGPTDLPADDGR